MKKGHRVDSQTLVNAAIAAGGTVLGWLIRVLWEADNELRTDLARLRGELPDTYARRDDVKALSEALFMRLDRLDSKMDRVLEKHS